MGLKIDWTVEVEQTLTLENMPVELKNDEDFHLLAILDTEIHLNLLSLNTSLSPEVLIELQTGYQSENKVLIHLWEDVWQTRKPQVLSRLKSLLGVNQRIHGRSTSVRKISKAIAENFLDLYHLQGSAGGRYHFGLYHREELVVVASFSNKRNMKNRAEAHTSAELIRFASKDGYTVTGGLSKLIKHYVKMAEPNDLMSYADRDWSQGKGYLSAGFHLKAITAPVLFYLDQISLKRYSVKQLPDADDAGTLQYLQIFNTGNLKYVLDLR